MKRVVILIAALSMVCAPAGAQGFLSKLKEQAAAAVGGAVLGESYGNAAEQTAEEAEAAQNDDPNAVVTGERVVPLRRASTFGWDGPVTPSSARFPIPLMNEFPAVPSAAALINPTEADQIAYYKAIKAVTMRAEELNAENGCDKEEADMWRKKTNDGLKEAFGLTDADIAVLENENASESEQKRVNDKIASSVLGGMDVNAMEADAARYENMSEEEMMAMMGNKTLQSQFAVYDRNAADINKYMGVTVAELKDAAREQMNQKNPDKPSPKSVALQKKSEAYQKVEAAKDPSFKKKADAFQQKLQGELRQAAMSNSRSMMGSMGAAMDAYDNAQKKMAPFTEMQNKLRKYENDIIACYGNISEDADYKFSASERKKVLEIKNKIYQTTNPSIYNPLYLQAIKLIQSYRERAAKVWISDVQKRFNAYKEALPKIIKINRQAIADGLIPECALYREPLNAVIIAGDILSDAYSEFPSDYPPMWKEEIVTEVDLPEGRCIWWPEFAVFGQSDFDAIVSGKHIYSMDADGHVTHLVGGSWVPVTDEEFKVLNGKKKAAGAPVSTSWTSSDGQRTVYYNADGGWLQMPEGDQVFPMAWKKDGNLLKWVITRDEGGKYQVILCTYML